MTQKTSQPNISSQNNANVSTNFTVSWQPYKEQAKKLILITGVSRGLGRAMTEQFIQLGHTVIGCALNKEAIASLQQQFSSPNHFSTETGD